MSVIVEQSVSFNQSSPNVLNETEEPNESSASSSEIPLQNNEATLPDVLTMVRIIIKKARR